MDFIIEFIMTLFADSLSESKFPLWVRRLFAVILIILLLLFSSVGVIMIRIGLTEQKIFPIIIGCIFIFIIVYGVIAVIKEYKKHKWTKKP